MATLDKPKTDAPKTLDKPKTDADIIAELEAENASLKSAKRIDELRADNARLRAGGKSPAQVAIDEKREKVRAETFKENGFAHYLLGRDQFNGHKVLPKGTPVKLPVDQLPPSSHLAVEAASQSGPALTVKA